MHNLKTPLGLRLIAAAKLAKGVLLACVSLGVFNLIHQDLDAVALRFIQAVRISPENRYVALLLEKLGLVDPATLVRLGVLSALYASILLLEGFGLWIGAAWAEFMVVASTGVFVPEELISTIHHFTWPRVAILAINAVILVYVVMLVCARYRERRAARAARAQAKPTDSAPPG